MNARDRHDVLLTLNTLFPSFSSWTFSSLLAAQCFTAWVFLEGLRYLLWTRLMAQCRVELGNRHWETGPLKDRGEGGEECAVSERRLVGGGN